MLTEDRVLSSISRNVTTSTISVRWDNRILRDGEVIQTTPHRKTYSEDMIGELVSEVPDAMADADLLGWHGDDIQGSGDTP